MTDDMDTTADPDQLNGSAVAVDDAAMPASPYETNPSLLPKDDPYLARSAHYGRYGPRNDDFKPTYDRWYQSEPDAVSYWEGIVRKFCTEENSLNVPNSREAFAAGGVIIRVDRESVDGEAAERYSCINANELSSSRKAEDALKEIGVAVPVILFCGTIEGKNVTVESRIPGVSLEVAWRYLTAEQINTLKRQCRHLIQRLGSVDSTSHGPSYVCSGLNSQRQPAVQKREAEILFGDNSNNQNLCMVHNDMVRPNIIVRDDCVVGITGWRQSGFFGYERAKKVHQEFRIPEPTFISSGGDEIGEPPWADLYDNLSESIAESVNIEKTEELAEIKAEPSTVALDTYPANDELEDKKSLSQLDGSTESRPTPKQVTNLRRDSRASSTSDRASPTTSAKPASTGKKARGGSKKGTSTKKPVNRKRKADSASIASSPAPEYKGKELESAAVEDEGEESYEDADELFCICRKPDNHTWMIGCDGGCEDWFHGKCVNIDSKDAELIERYICKLPYGPIPYVCALLLNSAIGPNCNKQGKGRTTWKPMCRLFSCRKPARAMAAKPSKYCSDEHGREFMRQHLNLVSGMATRKATATGAKKGQGRHQEGKEGLGSRGGVLTIGELKAAVTGVYSVEEFRNLGNRIVSPPPEPENPEAEGKKEKSQNNGILGLDVHPKDLAYSLDEVSKLENLHRRREEVRRRKELLEARNNFIGFVRQRAKSILEHLKKADPKGGWKDICGFDSRLAWSDEEFDEWRFSEAGQKALKDGTPEALAASYPGQTDADGDTAMGGAENDKNDLNSLTRGVCTKKRCERHKQWVKVQQQDILFEGSCVDQDLTKCEREAHIVVERAVLRMWAEGEDVHVNGE